MHFGANNLTHVAKDIGCDTAAKQTKQTFEVLF